MIDICSFFIIIAYEEVGGDNEENVKKQVVVHLTLQEYKVGGMMEPGFLLAFFSRRAIGFHRWAKLFKQY